ncbi:MAG TPA: hypothetical protein PKD41_08965 [Solidesulfovibrio sp.]|nr:hypothetical protein [Solidesulfovibrio sp.]
MSDNKPSRGGDGGNIVIIARDSIKGNGKIEANGGDGLIGGDGGSVTLISPVVDQNMTIQANAGKSVLHEGLQSLLKEIYDSGHKDRELYINRIERNIEDKDLLYKILQDCLNVFSTSTSIAPMIYPLLDALKHAIM